jgi:hypothetical protein
MRVCMTPELQLCACTKNQRSLQLIDTLLINCKNRWSNKTELENRTFFVHAHICDSGVMRTRMALIGTGTLIEHFLYVDSLCVACFGFCYLEPLRIKYIIYKKN